RTNRRSPTAAGAIIAQPATVSRRPARGRRVATVVLIRPSSFRTLRAGAEAPARSTGSVEAVAVVVLEVQVDGAGGRVEQLLGVAALVGAEERLGELLADHRVGRGDRAGDRDAVGARHGVAARRLERLGEEGQRALGAVELARLEHGGRR